MPYPNRFARFFEGEGTSETLQTCIQRITSILPPGGR